MMKRLTMLLLVGALIAAPAAVLEAASHLADRVQEGQFRTKPLRLESVGLEHQAVVRPEKIQRLNERLNRLAERLTARLERVSQLLERAKKLVAAFEARGLDLNLARGLEKQAATVLEAARQQVAALRTQLTPETPLEEAKALAQTAVAKVKQAHQAVVQVIRAIKASYSPPPQ